MTKVTYIEHNGTAREVEVPDGTSLMEGAINNLVPGIDGDCGGVCACATCHVHVDPAWIDKLPPMQAQEKAMVDLAPGADPTSRLACQIRASAVLAGIVLRTPVAQH